jgi:hypothetical protein
MKLTEILLETQFFVYQVMMRVTTSEDFNSTQTTNNIRAIKGVLTVTQVSSDELRNTFIVKVKIMTTQTPTEAFLQIKDDILKQIPSVKKVEIAEKTLEKVK